MVAAIIILHVLLGIFFLAGPLLIESIKYVYFILFLNFLVICSWFAFGECILKRWELQIDNNNIYRQFMNQNFAIRTLSDYTPLISGFFCIYRILEKK